ncbi:DNA polymerase-3 subunit delta' [Hasllibacter halocynthiae]|uniref:DNA polymerase-3 subunit delta n=1 Tax=Hasllibacter halocynthiae TaxID=595589 RepID=A0A2T0X700_9RHOB|nr:DNA polymerase III subunit delta' [Hasllibacter halocynthiae]PRY94709.1 DNA polymerase-3 subunit delta' [Hasllibacter halocynthiae]
MVRAVQVPEVEGPPESDRLPGAPHPREAPRVVGHGAAEAQFRAAARSGRLHHAWLLTGPRGIGKATLAHRLAAWLRAGMPEGDVPEDHPALRRARAGGEGGIHVIRRGTNATGSALAQQIRVDEVRAAAPFLGLSAPDGGWRALIVDAADEMNVQAQNALLKTLEEPPARTVIFLVAHAPSRLLPTIRSRCRVLRLAPLAPGETSEAMALAGAEADPALGELSGGSVGEAIRLVAEGGPAFYADLVGLVGKAPGMPRPAAIKLAESCAGPRNAGRLDVGIDLIDRMLARLARQAATGEAAPEAAPGEAAAFARHAGRPRRWADLHAELVPRLRHGRAVNLDPAGLILEALLSIDAAAG